MQMRMCAMRQPLPQSARRPAANIAGLGLEVDATTLAWGVSLLLIASYLLGGGEPRRPLRGGRGRGGTSAASGAAADAVSALENLGYSSKKARQVVQRAQGRGHRSFDAIFEAAQRQLR